MPEDEKNNEIIEDYLIEQDKLNCIGCGACVAVAPEHWAFDNEGKAEIIQGKERNDSWLEKNIPKSALKENVEAAESCPVNVIHIKSLKDDKKII